MSSIIKDFKEEYKESFFLFVHSILEVYVYNRISCSLIGSLSEIYVYNSNLSSKLYTNINNYTSWHLFLWGKGGLKLLEKMHDAQLNLFQTYGTNSYLKKKI